MILVPVISMLYTDNFRVYTGLYQLVVLLARKLDLQEYWRKNRKLF